MKASFLYRLLISIFTIVLILNSCKSDTKSNVSVEDEIENEVINDNTIVINEYVEKTKFIFYNMYSPIEMSGIFHDAGALYTPEMLNPVANRDIYSTSKKAAMNLGIYGVDLSYARMFDQIQVSIEYLATIKMLAERLGIPSEYVEFTNAKIEKNMSNRDSIMQIATEAYANADIYLKSGKRESTAALIVYGGWIESLFIASSIFSSESPEQAIMERIAEQKYSLNSIIILLSNFQTDIEIAEHIILLKKLKREFDTFEIYYEPGDFDIDTVNKVIALNRNKIDISTQQVLKIKKIIKDIRQKIVN